MRLELSLRSLGPAQLLLAFALLSAGPYAKKLNAQPLAMEVPRTTFVVFADRPMHDAEWAALFAEMRKGLTGTPGESMELAGDFDLVRGDQLVRGMEVARPVSVFLHGDCKLSSAHANTVNGPLGWVLRSHGQIESFIHVDCAQIEQVLQPLAWGMDANRRNIVMGEATGRVILHEWIHIATQSAAHSPDGVSKSSFGIADLLADDDLIRRNPRYYKRPRPGL